MTTVMMSTLQEQSVTNSTTKPIPQSIINIEELSCQCGVHLVPVPWLKAHEEFIPSRFEEVLTETVSAGGYHWPIIVDSKSGVILDGHHRHQVSLRLGLLFVPAVLVDYLGDYRISVRRWTPDSEHWTSTKGQEVQSTELPVWDSRQSSMKGAKLSVSESYSTTASESGHSNGSTSVSSNRPDFETARDDDVFVILEQQGPEDQESFDDETTPPSGSCGTSNLLVLTPPPTKAIDTISKNEVVQMGFSPNNYPPKTTRHFIPAELYCRPIFVPLEVLKGTEEAETATTA